MAKKDPRTDPRSVEDVPHLVAAGAAQYNAGEYWEAHEDWEEAWHALRAAGREADAHFLQGLILVTAAYENLARGKPTGFRRQMAEGLFRLRAHTGAGTRLGLQDEAAFVDAVVTSYLDGARRMGLAGLDDLDVGPPALRVNP